MDPHHLNADPYGIRIRLFTLIKIRIHPTSNFNADPDGDPDPAPHQSDTNQIIDHWSPNPPGLHFEPPLFHCEPLKLLNVDFNADPDPDPAFHSNVDPVSDPASQINADPNPQPG